MYQIFPRAKNLYNKSNMDYHWLTSTDWLQIENKLWRLLDSINDWNQNAPSIKSNFLVDGHIKVHIAANNDHLVEALKLLSNDHTKPAVGLSLTIQHVIPENAQAAKRSDHSSDSQAKKMAVSNEGSISRTEQRKNSHDKRSSQEKTSTKGYTKATASLSNKESIRKDENRLIHSEDERARPVKSSKRDCTKKSAALSNEKSSNKCDKKSSDDESSKREKTIAKDYTKIAGSLSNEEPIIKAENISKQRGRRSKSCTRAAAYLPNEKSSRKTVNDDDTRSRRARSCVKEYTNKAAKFKRRSTSSESQSGSIVNIKSKKLVSSSSRSHEPSDKNHTKSNDDDRRSRRTKSSIKEYTKKVVKSRSTSSESQGERSIDVKSKKSVSSSSRNHEKSDKNHTQSSEHKMRNKESKNKDCVDSDANCVKRIKEKNTSTTTTKNANSEFSSYMSIMRELDKQLNYPAPQTVDVLLLDNMSEDEVLKTFNKYSDDFNKTYELKKNTPQNSNFRGVGHIHVMCFLTEDIRRKMIAKLRDVYCKENCRNMEIVINCLLPLWIVCLFMDRYNLSIEDAVAHISRQHNFTEYTKAMNSDPLMSDIEFDF